MNCSLLGSSAMVFPRQEHWMFCHFFLQGIIPFQGLNLLLLHCRHILYHLSHQRSPDKISDAVVKSLPAMQETWAQFLGQEDTLEKEVTTTESDTTEHSSTHTVYL